MKLRHLQLVAILFAAFLSLVAAGASASSTAEKLAQLPTPFGARVQSVGSDVEHNAQLMSLATFQSTSSLADTAAFYKDLWSQEQDADRPGFVENRVGQWLVLGHVQEGYQTVLQLSLAQSHRSEGYLSVMQLDQGGARVALPSGIPGMERLSTTHSSDAQRVSELSVFSSSESVEPLARELSSYWQSQGWTLVSNEPYSQSRVLLLNRQSAQLEIVVSSSPGDGTLVVINKVDGHG